MKKLLIVLVFIVSISIFSEGIDRDFYLQTKVAHSSFKRSEKEKVIKTFSFIDQLIIQLEAYGATLDIQEGKLIIAPMLWSGMKKGMAELLYTFSIYRLYKYDTPSFQIINKLDTKQVYCEIDNFKISSYEYFDLKDITLNSSNSLSNNSSKSFSFSGNGTKNTRSFTVNKPWKLSYNNKGDLLQVYLQNDSGTEFDLLVNTLSEGRDETYCRKTGTFYFKVISIEGWELKVIEE